MSWAPVVVTSIGSSLGVKQLISEGVVEPVLTALNNSLSVRRLRWRNLRNFMGSISRPRIRTDVSLPILARSFVILMILTISLVVQFLRTFQDLRRALNIRSLQGMSGC